MRRKYKPSWKHRFGVLQMLVAGVLMILGPVLVPTPYSNELTAGEAWLFVVIALVLGSGCYFAVSE